MVESWTPMPAPQTTAPTTTATTEVRNDRNGTIAARGGSTTRPRNPNRSQIRPETTDAAAAAPIAPAYRTGTKPVLTTCAATRWKASTPQVANPNIVAAENAE